MNIILYTNNSEVNSLDKTLTQIAEYSGTLRNATDILNPVIVIDSNSATVFSANYAYIPDMNRYYFINNITVVNDNLYQLDMHVDVLTTYAAEIRAQTAIVERQENSYNLYLNDPMFKTYQNPIIVTKNFPNSFTALSVILLVAGGVGFAEG